MVRGCDRQTDGQTGGQRRLYLSRAEAHLSRTKSDVHAFSLQNDTYATHTIDGHTLSEVGPVSLLVTEGGGSFS